MSIIYSKFNNLESEKRERIINAAIEEFLLNGYDKASTNEIVKKANISKGSLFKYFNSKRELYLYLFGYVMDVVDIIYDEMDWSETDLFVRIREMGLIKLKIMKRFPQVFNFLKVAIGEESAEVKLEVRKIGDQALESGFGKIYDNIDYSKFRADIDVHKTIQLINWTMLGFAEQQRDRIKSFDELHIDVVGEWDSYLDIMRRCFYK